MQALAAAALAAEEGVDLNPFKPEFGLYVWVTIAFAVVLYFLAKKVFPKLEETLADREHRIKASLEEAEHTKQEAQKLLDDYKARVAQVREEANRQIEEARQTAESVRKDLVARAEAEAREILERAQQQLAGERDRVVAELERQLTFWSTQIASRIVERELSPESHRDLVEAFIREVQAEGSR